MSFFHLLKQLQLALTLLLSSTLLLAAEQKGHLGNWALVLPDGASGWLSFTEKDGQLKGELRAVGHPKRLTNLSLKDDGVAFDWKCQHGKPEYPGGPPSGKKIDTLHLALAKEDTLDITRTIPLPDGTTEEVIFHGKRMPPLPPQPDLSLVQFGPAIELFNNKNLAGWKLTNPNQINAWQVIDGELVNTSPKTDFKPYSKYGNLRTEAEFMDFHLSIEYKVPPGGNSGIYLRGVYEAQVLDHDSRMKGIIGPGSICGRIAPSENAAKAGDEWQHYDITLVDRHITVILNGKKTIDNAPLHGCTNGALHADETIPGPLYLQGDHTRVAYRNIILRPVIPHS